jgi:hypothetical protein
MRIRSRCGRSMHTVSGLAPVNCSVGFTVRYEKVDESWREVALVFVLLAWLGGALWTGRQWMLPHRPSKASQIGRPKDG